MSETVQHPNPASCALALYQALEFALGRYAETVIGQEATDYIAGWGYRLTVEGVPRVVVMREDAGGELFSVITKKLIPSMTGELRRALEVRFDEGDAEEFTAADMEHLEDMIRGESIRIANGVSRGAWGQMTAEEKAELKPTPYC